MAELRNLTPFANMQFVNLDTQGREFGIYMVKTAYDILPDGTCKVSDEQEPFALTDQFHGAINESSVRYASDLVPYKPATDVVLNATAFSRRARPTDAWECGIEIKHAGTDDIWLSKRLAVSGPREWRKTWLGWKLSDAEPISSLDIRYEHAFGGMYEDGVDEDDAPVLVANEKNTIGLGYVKSESDHNGDPIPAPQILFTSDTLDDPFASLEPAGFGPLPAAWLPRRPLGGTYDANWEENVWPNWPADYDFAFHSCASAGLSAPLPHNATLECRLTNLHPDKPVWDLQLPKPDLVALCSRDGEVTYQAFQLDTIYFDIADDRLHDPRIFMVSRMVFDWEETDDILLMQNTASQSSPDLLAPPHPHDVARFPEPEDVIPEEASA